MLEVLLLRLTGAGSEDGDTVAISAATTSASAILSWTLRLEATRTVLGEGLCSQFPGMEDLTR